MIKRLVLGALPRSGSDVCQAAMADGTLRDPDRECTSDHCDDDLAHGRTAAADLRWPIAAERDPSVEAARTP